MQFLFVILVLFGTSSSWTALEKQHKVSVSGLSRALHHKICEVDRIGETNDPVKANIAKKLRNEAVGLALGIEKKDAFCLQLMQMGNEEQRVLDFLQKIPRYINFDALQCEPLSGSRRYVVLAYQANQPRWGTKKTDKDAAINFLNNYVRCFGPDKFDWNGIPRPISERTAAYTGTLANAPTIFGALNACANETMLQALVESNCVREVETLLKEGGSRVNKEVVDNLSCTPFHVAVLKGNYPLVKILLEHGADVQGCSKAQNSPLCSAVVRRPVKDEKAHVKPDMVELLLQYGADINDPRENIFMAAADLAPMQVLAKLLQHQGKANVSIDGKGVLLYMAERRKDWTGFKEYVKPLLDMPQALAEKTDFEFNVLHAGALRDRAFCDSLSDEELKQLIEMPDQFGQTPVHILAMISSPVLKSLRERGVLSNSVLLQEDKLGRRPIDHALDLTGGNFDHPSVKAVMPDLSKAAVPGMSNNKLKALRRKYSPKEVVNVPLPADTSREQEDTLSAHQQPRDRMQKLTPTQLAQLSIGDACIAYKSEKIVAINDGIRMIAFSVENAANEEQILPFIEPYKDPKDDADDAHKISALSQTHLHRFGKDVTTDEEFIKKYGLHHIDPARHFVIALETAILPLYFDPQLCRYIKDYSSALIAIYDIDDDGSLIGKHLMLHKPKKSLHRQVATA